MNTTIESEKNAAAADVSQPKAKHAATKKAKPAKKVRRPKKAGAKPQSDRSNKKAEVIALMKRAKGVTLAEIMAVTKWQATPCGASLASWAARVGRRSGRPRTPRASGSTRSPR
jgi:hypothetical protein